MLRAFELKRKGGIGGDFAQDVWSRARLTMDSWLRLSAAIDAVNRKVGVGASWLILAMTLVSAANAVSRKAFDASCNAFLEIQWYLFAAVFLLAAGYTLLSNEQVRVDIVNTRFATRARFWINNPVFGRFYQSWSAFRHAQYQWYRIAEVSFSNFMAGQRLPSK